jgi:hypothetical protein
VPPIPLLHYGSPCCTSCKYKLQLSQSATFYHKLGPHETLCRRRLSASPSATLKTLQRHTHATHSAFRLFFNIFAALPIHSQPLPLVDAYINRASSPRHVGPSGARGGPARPAGGPREARVLQAGQRARALRGGGHQRRRRRPRRRASAHRAQEQKRNEAGQSLPIHQLIPFLPPNLPVKAHVSSILSTTGARRCEKGRPYSPMFRLCAGHLRSRHVVQVQPRRKCLL